MTASGGLESLPAAPDWVAFGFPKNPPATVVKFFVFEVGEASSEEEADSGVSWISCAACDCSDEYSQWKLLTPSAVFVPVRFGETPPCGAAEKIGMASRAVVTDSRFQRRSAPLMHPNHQSSD